jgi:hypothetical protein
MVTSGVEGTKGWLRQIFKCLCLLSFNFEFASDAPEKTLVTPSVFVGIDADRTGARLRVHGHGSREAQESHRILLGDPLQHILGVCRPRLEFRPVRANRPKPSTMRCEPSVVLPDPHDSTEGRSVRSPGAPQHSLGLRLSNGVPRRS